VDYRFFLGDLSNGFDFLLPFMFCLRMSSMIFTWIYEILVYFWVICGLYLIFEH